MGYFGVYIFSTTLPQHCFSVGSHQAADHLHCHQRAGCQQAQARGARHRLGRGHHIPSGHFCRLDLRAFCRSTSRWEHP